MTSTDKWIAQAAELYATMQNRLAGYDPAIRKAFIEGATYALSHQWVYVGSKYKPGHGNFVYVSDGVFRVGIARWNEEEARFEDLDWEPYKRLDIQYWMYIPLTPNRLKGETDEDD